MVAGQISRGKNFLAPKIPHPVEDPAELGGEIDFTWITSASAGDLWITGIQNVTDLDRFRMLHILGNP
jgi:hypothetical protein